MFKMTEGKKKIINLLVAEFLKQGIMPNAQSFRDKSPEDYLDILDEMGRERILRYGNNGRYEMPIFFWQFSNHWSQEEKNANAVLEKLKSLYKEDSQKQWDTKELAQRLQG